MRILFAVFALALGTVTCSPQLADSPASAEVVTNDNAVFVDPSPFNGRTVQVEAVFQGYRVGECRFAPAARSTSLTRSDWLVRRDANCLYVTGERPASLDPVDPSTFGKHLDLRARVIEDDAGKLLLQAIEVRPE